MSVWDWSTVAGTNSAADAAINWAEGQLPATVNNSARAMMAALKAFVQDTGGVTTAGASNAYTVTLTQTMASASKGIIGIIADRANTGAATLNVDGLGAHPLRYVSGVDLAAGDLVAGSFYIVTWESGNSEWLILTTPQQISAFKPGGRLTLSSGVPVMTSTVSGATTVYYTPYAGNMIPIWDGTNFAPKKFAEISQATSDSSKSPAAVTTNSNYDVFVWNDAGTITLSRGPAWVSGTARGTGGGTTELSRVQGILVNANAISNGPAAGYGTYVGTIRSNASSQIDFIYGDASAGGTAAVLNVWNMYNRVVVSTRVYDTTGSYTYNSATIRSANNSTGNRISFVSGLAEDSISVSYQQRAQTGASASNSANCGFAIDATNAVNFYFTVYTPTAAAMVSQQTAYGTYSPQIGSHYIQATESCTAGVTTTFGTISPCLMAVLPM